MKSVAVLEGWAGGPKLSQEFRRELVKQGFSIARVPETADVIVAHSTGCYFLPQDMKAELIMLINPPYWPGQSIIARFLKMSSNETRVLVSNFGYQRLVKDRLLEFFYFLAKPKYTYSVLRNQSHLDFLSKMGKRKTLLIRNENDEFCSPKVKEALKGYGNLIYIVLPGYHSDYYIHPKPYIDLLLKAI